MRQTRLKQSVNHLRPSFEAFVFPKALFRNITGEATEAPTEFLANQTVLLKNPKKSSPFLSIMDFICIFPGFFIKTSENWYSQNRTGRTARSGLAVDQKVTIFINTKMYQTQKNPRLELQATQACATGATHKMEWNSHTYFNIKHQ